MVNATLGDGAKIGEAGKHFTDSQDKDSSFRNISSTWTAQCMSFDQGRQKLATQQSQIQDHREALSDWKPVVDAKGRFAVRRLADGRDFVPTEHALKQIAVVGETSDWFLQDLRSPKKSNKVKEEHKFQRDRSDAELLVKVVEHTLFNKERIDQDKKRLFRTWSDGTLRALLSEQYAIVNNEWYLAVLQELIPGGLLSHWRGDADTIFGNVLIPDTIRQESDSAYGGMLSVGNSEIGLRRIMSLPSTFRAICMNGCIWGECKGDSVRKVHRGDVDLSSLKHEIQRNLNRQIPLLDNGITQMLGTRSRGFGNASTIQMLCALAKTLRINRKNMVGVRNSFDIETAILGNSAKTSFGLIAALTRHGQSLDANEWVSFDQLGGNLTTQTDSKWNSMRALACTITDDDEIKKTIGISV